MTRFDLNREHVGLLILDAQDKMVSRIEQAAGAINAIQQMAKAFEAFRRPILIAEQDPSVWGKTIPEITSVLSQKPELYEKSSFSCLGDKAIGERIHASGIKQWIVTGFQAHVSVLQSARALKQAGFNVVVLNDAIGSRSVFDYSTAIAELKECGVRVSSAEIVLFELLQGSTAPEYEAVTALIP